MRFRGQLREPEVLSKMIQLLLKVKKTCVVCLSAKDFKFIISGDPDALIVWAGCDMVFTLRANFVEFLFVFRFSTIQHSLFFNLILLYYYLLLNE